MRIRRSVFPVLLAIPSGYAGGEEALATQLARDPKTGRFRHGDTPTIADCCLVPQRIKADDAMYEAERAGRNCFRLLAPGNIRN